MIPGISFISALLIIVLSISDMSDNYDKDRLSLLSKEVQKRLTKKYDNNLKLLKEALDNEKS